MNQNQKIFLKEYVKTYLHLKLLREREFIKNNQIEDLEIFTTEAWVENSETDNPKIALPMIEVILESSKTATEEVKYYYSIKILELLYPYFCNENKFNAPFINEYKNIYYTKLNTFITEFSSKIQHNDEETLQQEIEGKFNLIVEFKEDKENQENKIYEETIGVIEILNSFIMFQIDGWEENEFA